MRIRLSQASWAGAGPELGNKRRSLKCPKHIYTIPNKVPCLNFTIRANFTTSPGWAGGVKLWTVKIRLSQASWAGAGPELGNKSRSLKCPKHIFTPKKFGKFLIHTLLPSSGPAPAQLAWLSIILIYSRNVAKDPPKQTLVAFGLKMENQQQDLVIEFENCLKKLPSFWVDHIFFGGRAAPSPKENVYLFRTH